MRHYTVGTRGSALALWQTRHVSSLLATVGVSISERVITTKGDTSQAEKLAGKLEKGFFTEELESALRSREIDWAVHSLKDLPTRMPAGLVLGAVLERAAAADVLIARLEAVDEKGLIPLKAGSRVGSSSLRREAMLQHFAPETISQPLRGNVPTRVGKLRDGLYDAILLAEAGVSRLQLPLDGLAVFRLNPLRWQCAPGQGAVAVQCRADDSEVIGLVRALHHEPTAYAVNTERDFLRILEGGCTTPFGCYIADGRASLGLATETGWKRQTVMMSERPDTAWLAARLEELTTSREESHDWLARRI
ncbi:MAG: hydroxymethylbilane synthase [Archangium sp.]|nr:hydroxymethylbilane synthase [Archangium sp.]MDP3569857.1 hydroxymethylbilane synthase [Archangium sp.]